MFVYKAEKEAGLSDLLKSNTILSYLVDLTLAQDLPIQMDASKVLVNPEFLKASENQSIDLFPLRSILVTTCWNENDDVFDRYETWAARNTGKDKPFTFEHNCDDIIGHLTSSYPVDEKGVVLADDLVADDLPAKFHIATNAVLYRHWTKAEKQERMNKILEEIPKGLWQVSVEALFGNFDYIIRDGEGGTKIVARNQNTAFLTQYLKAYKGPGTYQNQKIGRLVRNILFSGKGLTRKPANPESIIFAKKFDVDVSSEILLGYSKKDEVLNMSQEINTKLEVENKELRDQLAKLTASINAGETEKLAKENEGLRKSVKDNQDKSTSLEAALATAQNELKASKETVEKLNKDFGEAKARLDKIEADAKHQSRISMVATKLGFDEKKTQELVATLVTLNDESFAKAIDMQADVLKAAKVEKPEAAAAKVLEEAVTSTDKKDVALTAGATDNGVEKVRTDMVNFLTASDKTESK